MTRAMTSPELVLQRTPGQWSKLYLVIRRPNTIYTARVSSTPSTTDRVLEVSYNSGAGTLADVRDGMLILVGSSAGARDKGVTRVRGIDAGKIYPQETSHIDWQSGDYLTIVDDFRPWIRPSLTVSNTLYMDGGYEYTDQHENFDPVPNMGMHRAAWLVEGVAETEWDASSWVIGSTIETYVWEAPGAASTSGMGTAYPTISYDTPGDYVVYCTVTADNGKSFRGVRYVSVFDLEHLPVTAFQVKENPRGDSDGGWGFAVKMFDEAAQADVCDGAFVILFAEDWYGGEKISMGPLPGCENIITFGWIAGETIEWDVEGGSVDFRIDGLGKWLRQMPAIPFTLKYKSASASKWSEMTDMDTLRILYHICHERSTLTMITDVTLPDDARISPDITIGQSSLWQQLEDVAGRIFARPACDRYGRLFVEVDPQATPEADRDFPTVMTITQQDIVERLTWDRRTQATTSMLDMSGKTLGSNNKVVNYYSKATGHDDLREGARETVDNILTDDQAQLNEICGLVMGWRNNPWNTLPINLAQNNRFIDIAPRQYLEITAEAADSPRELEFSGRVIPRSVELVWNMEDGTLTTQLECEAESFPMLAIDGDAPPEPVTPPPPPIPPTPPPTPPPVPGALPPNAIVLLQGIGIYYTENLDTTTAGGQKWFPMNDGLPDPTLVRHVEISSSGNCYCQYSNESIWYARLGGVWEMIFHTDDIGNPESKPYPRGPQVVAFGIDRDADDTLLILAGLTLTIYSQFAMYCWYGSHNSLTLTSSVHVNVNYGFRSGGSLTYGDGLWLASYSTTTGKYALKLSGNGASAMSETYFGDWDDIAAVTVQGRLSPGIVLANETIPLLSTDGGATFDALASAPVPYWTSGYFEWGESMANNEDGSKIVIAVDDVIGFRRSSDSGATWENTLMPGVCKAVWHLGGDGYLFSAGTVFLLFTPDFGETYEDVTGDLYEQVGLFSVLQIRTL